MRMFNSMHMLPLIENNAQMHKTTFEREKRKRKYIISYSVVDLHIMQIRILPWFQLDTDPQHRFLVALFTDYFFILFIHFFSMKVKYINENVYLVTRMMTPLQTKSASKPMIRLPRQTFTLPRLALLLSSTYCMSKKS